MYIYIYIYIYLRVVIEEDREFLAKWCILCAGYNRVIAVTELYLII
jgi:hypothetical protein